MCPIAENGHDGILAWPQPFQEMPGLWPAEVHDAVTGGNHFVDGREVTVDEQVQMPGARLFHPGGCQRDVLNPQIDLEPFRDYLNRLESVSLGTVTSMLGDLQHHHARKMVYSLLGERGGEAMDLVGNYVYDKRWFVVRNVALVLGRVNRPRAVTFLKKASVHPDTRVRLEAIRSLGELRCPEADELLLKFIDDPDPNLQIHAFKALAYVQAPKVFEALEKRIHNAKLWNFEARVLKELLCAYARSGGARSLPFLLSVINKKRLIGRARWEKVKVYAVYALGEVGSSSILDILRKISGGSDSALRTAARQVLERFEQSAVGDSPPAKETLNE